MCVKPVHFALSCMPAVSSVKTVIPIFDYYIAHLVYLISLMLYPIYFPQFEICGVRPISRFPWYRNIDPKSFASVACKPYMTWEMPPLHPKSKPISPSLAELQSH